MVGVVIVAHAPFASSLLACATHVFGVVPDVLAYDVGADDAPEKTEGEIRRCIDAVSRGDGVLILADMLGATPSNQAEKASAAASDAGTPTTLVAGANVPMLLRALTNRHLPLTDTVQRVLAGGAQGILQVDCHSHD